MSGNNSYIKSMNGIVSFDSNGTTIDGDVITSGEIDCTTLNATDVNATGSLNTSYIFVDFMDKNIGTYITFISDVLFDYKLYASSLWPSIGSEITVNGLLNITNRLKTESIEGLGTNSTTKQLKIGQDNNNTTSINIGRASQTILGTTYPAIPPRTTFYAVGDDDITNKKYVDTVTGGVSILATTNTFTGTSNTFNNVIKTSKIDSITPSSTYDLLTSHTGALNVGITASSITLGSVSVPVRCAYLPLITTDLCNKSYVDTVSAGVGTSLLASTNTWTGASNTFNNKIIVGNITCDTNTLTASPTTNAIDLFKTTTGDITIGGSSTLINVGNFRFTAGNIETNNIALTEYGILNNVTTSTIRIGHGQTSANIAIGNLKTSGEINIMNTGVSSGDINLGSNLTTGVIRLITNSSTATVQIASSLKLWRNNLEYFNTDTTLNLFNNLISTVTMNMGGSGIINLCNSFKISTNTIVSTNINDIINVFNNITTGTINFCNGLTTGLLQIGGGKINFGNQQISGYTEYNTTSVNFTIPSTINKEYFIVITGGSPITVTLPSSTAVIGQIINIRNRSNTITHNITTFPSTTIGIYPTQAGSARFQPAWTMPGSSAQRFYFDGSNWVGF